MPTTTNFGWTTPADTDLVKDGASAIRTLGNGVDASMADLKGGTSGQILSKNSNTDMDFVWINNDQGDITAVTAGTGLTGGGTTGAVTLTNDMATAINAKGDLIAGTANDAYARLGVGTNGQILTADSAEATGLKWITPAAAGGMTLLKTQALSSSSTTISSISTDYKHLLILGKDIYSSTNDSGSGIGVRFNSDTGNNYYMYLVRNIGGSAGGGSDGIISRIDVTERVSSSTTIDKLSEFELWAYRYTDTDTVSIYNRGYGHSGTQGAWLVNMGRYDNSAAITSVTVFSPNSYTLTGTVYVYGVS